MIFSDIIESIAIRIGFHFFRGQNLPINLNLYKLIII